MEDHIKEEQTISKKIWLFILDITQTFVVTGAVFFFITYFFFRPFQVSGNSMYSNYKDKEYIITNLISLRFSNPTHGDVIVFKSPSDQNKDFIKRIIAIQGDEIFIENGKVYLNGDLLKEEYLDPCMQTFRGEFLHEGVNKTVPNGDVFIMGDKRNDSTDSRTWGFVNR